MPYDDWDIYNTGSGTLFTGIEIANPILGNASLLVSTTDSMVVNIVPTDANMDYPKGFTAGKYQHIFRYEIVSGVTKTFGIAFMQSANNITTGAVDYYLLHVVLNGSGVVTGLELRKIVGGSGALLVSAGGLSIAQGTSFALSVQWFYDNTQINGVAIEVSIGYALDYSDLNPAFAYTDRTSPLSSSVAEGIYSSGNSGSGNHIFSVEFTRLYELV